MSLYTPETVTLWVIQTESPEVCHTLFEFGYDEDGEVQLSPFAEAYRLGWYDTDFAEFAQGSSVAELLTAAAETCRTLDEQAVNRIPAGDWNGIYLIYGQAGEEWQSPDSRPPMPHGVVALEGANFRLVDTFHVLIRPD